MNKIQIAILMGSDSDYPVMQKAEEVLKEFNIGYVTRVLSAHRTPKQTIQFIAFAEKKGVKIFIAGVVAAYTVKPVIGVPIMSKSMNGLDSLLSIVQMPPGVPVATVAIDGAKNAALLAIQILGTGNPGIAKNISVYKKKMERDVLKKDKMLNR